MITRGKYGIRKPKVLNVSTSSPKPKDDIFIEPKTIKMEFNIPHWKQAMDTKYEALLKNKTWSLTKLPPGCNLIGCKWVYKVKTNADGSLNRHKARLVAKGFHQRDGFDFHETFSPVVKPTTIRVMLSITLT
uniref:Reverse transcriptase Ty1/copia-type domain-containing protein n=1 Tax=Cajanus cajan TaxID=3821 RepID=A0A151S057_CAJCA|nr:hypothetical protein KK1_030088 [Cajanus cajan]